MHKAPIGTKQKASLGVAKPGDVIWIPANTPLRYEGKAGKIFYTVYPVDWKKRAGM